MPFNQRMEKMWFITIMEFYSVIKNKAILKFAGRWRELENIMLREATQIKRTCMTYTHL